MYAGRSAVYTMQGDATEIELPLECVSPWYCEAYPQILASVEADTFSPPEAWSPQALDVHQGYVLWMGEAPPYHALFNPVLDLQLVSGLDPPQWSATLDEFTGIDPDWVCTIATKVGAGPTVSTASCEGIIADQVYAQSYWLSQRRIDEALQAIGLEGFPAGGLLMGRMTRGGFPANGAQLAPQTGTAMTTYLELQRIDVSQPPTPDNLRLVAQTNGSWFVVREANLEPEILGGLPVRCCDFFDATAGTGGTGTTPGRVGLIDGVVMATEIEIN
jgi:hypothetical protein